MFAYCTEVLRLSEHAAYHRILAARMARRFPVVLRMRAQGSLNLTSARLLAAHLTQDNHDELLAAASGKSKRQVQELLARRFPQPEIASSIRKLPAPGPAAEPPAAPARGGPAVGDGAPAAAAQEPRTLATWSPTFRGRSVLRAESV